MFFHVRSYIVAVVLSIATALQLSGQEAPLRLSLEEAQQLAIERNLTLQNASIDVKIAKANRWQALASLMP